MGQRCVVFLISLFLDKRSIQQRSIQVENLSWGSGVGEARDIVTIQMYYLQLEPIGTFFMIAFILIIGIQFVGMIQHRLMTLSHIVATTNKTFNAAEERLQNK